MNHNFMFEVPVICLVTYVCGKKDVINGFTNDKLMQKKQCEILYKDSAILITKYAKAVELKIY